MPLPPSPWVRLRWVQPVTDSHSPVFHAENAPMLLDRGLEKLALLMRHRTYDPQLGVWLEVKGPRSADPPFWDVVTGLLHGTFDQLAEMLDEKAEELFRKADDMVSGRIDMIPF